MSRAVKAAVAVVTVAGLVALGAVAHAGAVRMTVVEPAAAAEFHAYRQQGPSADYSGDVGAIGLMRPVAVALTERADVVVSFSFGYRASQDPFAASLRVQGPNDSPRDATPGARRIRPTAHRDSTTLQYLVADVPPGTYRFSLEVNVDGRWRTPARIATHQVLISGTVTPSP